MNQEYDLKDSIPHYNHETSTVHLDLENKIAKVLYCIVLPEESQILIDKYGFRKDVDFSEKHKNLLETFVLFDNLNNLEIIIVRPLNDPLNNTPLFGTEISFLISYLATQYYDPDVIISFGYAGSTGKNKNLKLGDIVLSRDCGYYFRRNMIIEYYQKTSMGLYPVYNCKNASRELNFPLCKIGSSNSFVNHDTIATSKGVEVVEMELCSIARVAYYFKIPCLGLKIISDCSTDDELTDEKEREKIFLESLVIMRNKIGEAFEKFNSFIVNKKLGEL